MAFELSKNPIIDVLKIVGERDLWPSEIIRRVFAVQQDNSKKLVVELCAFLYLNGVPRRLAVNVFRTTGAFKNYYDISAALKSCYNAWDCSRDLRQEFESYWIKCKKRGIYNLDREFQRDAPITMQFGFSGPVNYPTYSPGKPTSQMNFPSAAVSQSQRNLSFTTPQKHSFGFTDNVNYSTYSPEQPTIQLNSHANVSQSQIYSDFITPQRHSASKVIDLDGIDNDETDKNKQRKANSGQNKAVVKKTENPPSSKIGNANTSDLDDIFSSDDIYNNIPEEMLSPKNKKRKTKKVVSSSSSTSSEKEEETGESSDVSPPKKTKGKLGDEVSNKSPPKKANVSNKGGRGKTSRKVTQKRTSIPAGGKKTPKRNAKN